MKTPNIRFKGFTDDWEQRKLEDVVEFLDTLRKPLEGAKRVSGPYPYYGASGIVDYVDGYIFDEELILLSEDGANITDRNYPVCFLASGKYWVNNHAHVLKCKDGNENNFICNSLERKDYKQYNSGMAMPKLNQEVCRGIPVSCPKYEEQKKIGDYFRSLDNLITLHQRKCDETKELKKYMLQKMFPKKGEKNPEIRFEGFTDDWEQRKVSDLLEERNEQAPESEDYPLMAFIANEGVAPKGERYDRGALVKDAENKNYKKTELGDFIYSSNNLETGSIGLNNYGNASISPVYSIFKPTGIADSDFIGRRFVRKDFINAMVKWRQGVVYGQWKIHESDFLKIEVAVPSLEEQRKIGLYLSELDNLITLHQGKCDKLKELKKYMLQNMFPKKG
ncbi:restriction endonuclease subunit S [Eubacterium xylanophilum]|uniref:restriction endonuclease subunit S n=1 Tax=Eubacterium xylanophilum TaxID=39497 RepID=UPI000478FF76|nr:restriction endonuclease subunit S [Eubacterium xylanophilum]